MIGNRKSSFLIVLFLLSAELAGAEAKFSIFKIVSHLHTFDISGVNVKHDYSIYRTEVNPC